MFDWLGVVLTSSVIAGVVSSSLNYFFNERTKKQERLYHLKKQAYLDTLQLVGRISLTLDDGAEIEIFGNCIGILYLVRNDDILSKFMTVTFEFTEMKNITKQKGKTTPEKEDRKSFENAIKELSKSMYEDLEFNMDKECIMKSLMKCMKEKISKCLKCE